MQNLTKFAEIKATIYYLVNFNNSTVIELRCKRLVDGWSDGILFITVYLVLDETTNVESAVTYLTGLHRNLQRM